LGKVGRPVSQVLPSLVKRLSDDCWQVRRTSAEALGRVGLAAFESVAHLEKAAEGDTSGMVCVAAAAALFKVRGQAESSVEMLTRQLRALDFGVQTAAAEAL